jgi:TonB family protein
LRLTDVPTPAEGGEQSQLRLPGSTPGEAIRQASQAAARGRATGAIGGLGDSDAQLNNPGSNFSIGGAQILSDTQGVDFGPYLARVVFSVRRNWYSVIPISAQMGQKGRVAIVFEIIKDGSVPQLRLVGSSGSEPLDRAALSAINMSNPFPQLPADFTGNHLVLQFIFLYNLGTSP